MRRESLSTDAVDKSVGNVFSASVRPHKFVNGVHWLKISQSNKK